MKTTAKSSSSIILTVAAASLLVAALSGCSKSGLLSGPGYEVRFSAGASYMATGTRAGYTGEVTSGTPATAAINWSESDILRLYCPENNISEFAVEPVRYYADYSLKDVTGSNATITHDDMYHGLRWSDDDPDETIYHFYGLYPGPSMSGAQSGIAIGDESTEKVDDVKATCVIPATQSGTKSVTEGTTVFTPDPCLLYMAARTVGKRSEIEESESVFLKFIPLPTVIEFEIQNAYDDNSDMLLKSVALSSSAVNLSGTFTADLAGWTSGTYPVCTASGSDAGDTVSISMTDTSGSPLTVAYGDKVRFTFFLMPCEDATGLSFSVTTTQDGKDETISLKLEDKDAKPVEFGACQKHFIKGIMTPKTATFSINETVIVCPWTYVADPNVIVIK